MPASADTAANPRPASSDSWWDRRGIGAGLVAALTAAAAVLLAAGIQVPWPWSDEGATYLALQRSWTGLAVLFGSQDAPWVPYYALAKAWTLGSHTVVPGLSTLVAVRLFSACAAVATVMVLYAIVARNAGRLAGLLAGVLLLGLPGFVRFAQEARGYALLGLAATLSWLLLDRRLRPGLVPTLLGSARAAPEPTVGRAPGPMSAAGYALSLAGVAVVHTFGVFQWPAHLVETLTAPASSATQRRRLRSLVLVGAAAALLASVQLALSLEHGTGPDHAQAGRLVTAGTVMAQLARGISATAAPAASLPVLLLVVVGAMGRVNRSREFPRSLMIWLGLPLLFEIGLGAVRTNLFRLRYWIAFLSPLAALAALGIVGIAASAARLVRRVPSISARGLSRGVAVLLAVLALGLQAGAALQAQERVRAIDGHGENLTAVLAVLARVQNAHPGLVTAISSGAASGMLAAAEPSLLAENPLRRRSGCADGLHVRRAAVPHPRDADRRAQHSVDPPRPGVGVRRRPADSPWSQATAPDGAVGQTRRNRLDDRVAETPTGVAMTIAGARSVTVRPQIRGVRAARKPAWRPRPLPLRRTLRVS